MKDLRTPLLRSGSGGGFGPESVYEQLRQHRIIFLGKEVDDEIANLLCAQMLLLAAEDPERDIQLYINSPGGSVTAGMAIYDTMQLIKPDVQTVAMGMAASMGQLLLTAGAPGKRLVLPHAEILMHQGSSGVGGDETDIAIQAKRLVQMGRVMAEITARETGQTVETILRDSDRDRWFTAEEAVAYGLADRVIQTTGVFDGVETTNGQSKNGASS